MAITAAVHMGNILHAPHPVYTIHTALTVHTAHTVHTVHAVRTFRAWSKLRRNGTLALLPRLLLCKSNEGKQWIPRARGCDRKEPFARISVRGSIRFACLEHTISRLTRGGNSNQSIPLLLPNIRPGHCGDARFYGLAERRPCIIAKYIASPRPVVQFVSRLHRPRFPTGVASNNQRPMRRTTLPRPSSQVRAYGFVHRKTSS